MNYLTANHDASHSFMQSSSGRRVRSTGLEGPITPHDFVHSCATSVRFGGHIRGFYSVAEHQVLCSLMARDADEPVIVQRCCSVHDGHEAWTRDWPSPWKNAIAGLREFETERFEIPFRQALALPPNDDPVWDAVKHYDIIALHAETAALFDSLPNWVDPTIVSMATRSPLGLEWWTAEELYGEELRRLGFW